jgi:hypothetical protein
VKYYIAKAIHYYSWGCTYMSGVCLGRALHYLMDEAVFIDPKTRLEEIAQYMTDSRRAEMLVNTMCSTALSILSEFRKNVRKYYHRSLLIRAGVGAVVMISLVLAAQHPLLLALPLSLLVPLWLAARRSRPRPPDEVQPRW